MTARQIARLRRQLVAAIRQQVTPHLWESGYKTGPIGSSVPLRLWVKDRGAGLKAIQIGGYVLDELMGVTADGVITGVSRMSPALVVTDYDDLPLEDLMKLDRWATRTFKTKVA